MSDAEFRQQLRRQLEEARAQTRQDLLAKGFGPHTDPEDQVGNLFRVPDEIAEQFGISVTANFAVVRRSPQGGYTAVPFVIDPLPSGRGLLIVPAEHSPYGVGSTGVIGLRSGITFRVSYVALWRCRVSAYCPTIPQMQETFGMWRDANVGLYERWTRLADFLNEADVQ